MNAWKCLEFAELEGFAEMIQGAITANVPEDTDVAWEKLVSVGGDKLKFLSGYGCWTFHDGYQL